MQGNTEQRIIDNLGVIYRHLKACECYREAMTEREIRLEEEEVDSYKIFDFLAGEKLSEIDVHRTVYYGLEPLGETR